MLQAASNKIKPSGCGCGTSAASPRAPVYVVGSLGFDFGTEGRRDALFAANNGVPMYDSGSLVSFLAGSPSDAASIIWTLSDDQHPIYAIRPTNAYGANAYEILRNFLAAGVDRVSVPGWIVGKTRLMNGWVVPVIEPDVQGLRSWSTTSVAGQLAVSGGVIDVSSPMPVALPTKVDLTEQGKADWVYWGNTSVTDAQRSAAGQGQITDFTVDEPSAIVEQAIGSPSYVFLWSNGQSIPTGSAVNAVRLRTVGAGFSFTAPADGDTHTLYLYVSATNAVGTLVVSLEDNSASPVSVSTSGNGAFLIKITYHGVAAGTLLVKWILKSRSSATGSITLQAAALQESPSQSLNTNQSDLQNFLDRIYFELRNKGTSPEERARNFAATQAYFVNNVITYAIGHGLNLQNMAVSHSPLCRPGSECWDVTLSFFDPENPTTSALKVFRFVVDVSDVKPVMVGPMYRWNSY